MDFTKSDSDYENFNEDIDESKQYNCIKHANNLTGFLGFVKGPDNETTEETSNRMNKTIDGIDKYILKKKKNLQKLKKI